jgi:hypothetical protein
MDITINNSPRLRRILSASAKYKVLEDIYRNDPEVGPKTAAMLREAFRAAADMQDDE